MIVAFHGHTYLIFSEYDQVCSKVAVSCFLVNVSYTNTGFIQVKLCQVKGLFLGAQWLSGRTLDLRPGGRGFEPHRCRCIVSLSKTY